MNTEEQKQTEVTDPIEVTAEKAEKPLTDWELIEYLLQNEDCQGVVQTSPEIIYASFHPFIKEVNPAKYLSDTRRPFVIQALTGIQFDRNF